MPGIYTSQIDLFSSESLADPYENYNTLREGGAVSFLEQHGLYALTRFADVRNALRAPEVFISGKGVMMNEPMNANTAGKIMLCSDGPQHQGMRRMFQRPLMPDALEAVKQQIVDEAGGLVDRLVAKGSFDAVTELAQYLPVKIVSELVGLPEEGREKMLEWAEAGFDCFGPIGPRNGPKFSTTEDTIAYMMANNRPGLVKPGGWVDMLHAAAKEIGLPPEAPVMMGIDYMGPSLDTTIHGISAGVRLFAENPGEWDKLREDMDLMPSAINEILRIESPIQMFARVTAEDVTIDDATIPADARVIVCYGAANRDPEQWDDPTAFRIDRNNHQTHLAFGAGPHMCAGSHLAKLEMSAIFTALAEKVSRFDIQDPMRAENSVLRGLAGMEVQVS